MIKTAKDIHTELKKMISYPSKESEDLLRKWAISIVNECEKQALQGWTDAPVRDESETISEYVDKVREQL